MRHQRKNANQLNLDSLVDIVSNNVGILIILAIFMAMFSLIQTVETRPTPQEEEQELEITEKVLIPWSKYTQKTSHLFYIKENRLLYLNRSLVYEKLYKEQRSLTGRGTNLQSGSTTYPFNDYSVTLSAFSSYVHCLDFQPLPGVGEWWHQVIGNQGILTQLQQNYRPEEYYFFFWVDNDSFELFRDVRQYLWNNKFEVSWKPVGRQSPLRFCSGSRELSFQPQ